MEIKILGSGCKKCKKLDERVRKVLGEKGLEARVSKVEDLEAITAYGVMQTPALVIDEKVVSSGRLLTKKEIQGLLSHEND